MVQPDTGMHVRTALEGSERLVLDAVDLVYTCMSSSRVPADEVIPLLQKVCGALVETTRSAMALEPELERLGFGRPATPEHRLGSLPEARAIREITVTEALADLRPEIELRSRTLFGSSGVEFLEIRETAPDLSVPGSPIVAPSTVENPVKRKKKTFSKRVVAPEPVALVSGAEPNETVPLPAEAPARPGPRKVPVARKKAPVRARRPQVSARAIAPVPSSRTARQTPPASVPKARPSKQTVARSAGPKLPRGLKSVGDALRMDVIVCLEDGKKVKDLGAHLKAKGIERDAYLAKWKLPASYPMTAPLVILRRGPTHEYDIVTGRFRPVRV